MLLILHKRCVAVLIRACVELICLYFHLTFLTRGHSAFFASFLNHAFLYRGCHQMAWLEFFSNLLCHGIREKMVTLWNQTHVITVELHQTRTFRTLYRLSYRVLTTFCFFHYFSVSTFIG